MEDLIRRQDAIEKLCKRCQISNDGMCEEGDCIDLKLIRLVPSVDAIPLEWINKWEQEHPHEELGDMLNDWQDESKKRTCSGN